MLDMRFGVAKVNKYASRESGDTFELVERPVGMGGLTGIMVDGQGTGRSAKNLSNFVAGHCIALLKQGVRDGVVARAANDQLYSHKLGQVSATLNLLSVDLVSQTVVISRNNPQPVYVADFSSSFVSTAGDRPAVLTLAEESVPLGIYPRTRPVIRELPLKPGLVVVTFTDGLSSAGERYNASGVDIPHFLTELELAGLPEAQILADRLLELALTADRRRPQDDTCVMVLTTHEFEADDGDPLPRRLAARITHRLKVED